MDQIRTAILYKDQIRTAIWYKDQTDWTLELFRRGYLDFNRFPSQLLYKQTLTITQVFTVTFILYFYLRFSSSKGSGQIPGFEKWRR
jgi:hypothetical protein